MRTYPFSIHEAKELLRIPALWRFLNLPGEPPSGGRGACISPFRPDRHPSFSIYDAGRRWKDHATGQGGDAIEFVMVASGLDKRSAVHRFLELAGLPAPQVPERRPAFISSIEPKIGAPDVSWLGVPTATEVQQIAKLRHLDPRALSRLVEFGILRTGRRFGRAVWALVDGPSGEPPRVAEIRRMDGARMASRHDPEGVKGMTLPGSRKDWPVGASMLAHGGWGGVLFCEGMPDLLAAEHFALKEGRHDLCPVTILGRQNRRIYPRAIELLEDSVIRFFPHADADGGGLAATEHWADQIPGAHGGHFDLRGLKQVDGSPINDLNDAVRIHPEDAYALVGLLP